MKPTIHLVHGFNVRDKGAGTTDTLRPYFEALKYTVVEHDFGFRFLLGVRFGNAKRAQQLADKLKSGDILVGHSDGCNIITQALRHRYRQHGRRESYQCIFFNPALNRNTKQADNVRKVLVFCTPTDRVVWLAKFSRINRPWGQMGRLGYRGPQRDIYRNIFYESLFLNDMGHSKIFQKPYRVQRIMDHIRILPDFDL